MRRIDIALPPLLLALAVPAPAGGAPRRAVAVISLTGGAGFDPKTLGSLEELLLAALARTGEFHVIGRSDVAQLVGLEREKQLLGCVGDSCIAEIGGALGTEYVGAADVAKLGETRVLTLKLIDARRALVVARVTRTTRTDAGLPAAVDALAREATARAIASEDPHEGRARLAVRAGAGSHLGILGVGLALQAGRFGVALGTGTHLLSGGVSFSPLGPAGGPYLDLHAALVRPGLVGTQRPTGLGAGATVGYDWRPVRWLTLKAGAGLAWNSANPEKGLFVFDLCGGAVFPVL